MPPSADSEVVEGGGETSQVVQNLANMSNMGAMEHIKEQFTDLCRELNLDPETERDAWKNYQNTKISYTLEGDQLHWLACSIYVSCRKGEVPTVGKGVQKGNGVSLTRILKSTKLSLLQFFIKIKKWVDMNHMKKELQSKIDQLERNFSVSNVIFKKYQPIFVDLFKDPSDDPKSSKADKRSRKSKRPNCTPGELFDFCWTLFIRIKAVYPSISDDLVNSYHLLLATCDYVYCNAFIDKREDLLNENFMTVPLEDVDLSSLCILDKLCTSHDGIIQEVKTIREHFFREDIRKCFDNKKLVGDQSGMMGILNSAVFESNFKNITKDYEIHVLSIGEYDERVFLGEEANEEIGTPTKRMVSGELEAGLLGRRQLQSAPQFNSGKIVPNTPLSGRNYIRAKEEQMTTPVGSVTHLVSCLNKSLSGRKDEPSERLKKIIGELKPNGETLSWILEFVKNMGDKFISQYDSAKEKQNSFAIDRLRKATGLYYKMLEKIILDESKMGKNVTMILDHENFHKALYIACLEIVIFSYNSPTKTFPWALETFELEPFHFYKVIEIMIRTEDGIARDVIKHLQNIEEQILERLAWKGTSPVWKLLEGSEVPSCEQVSLRQGHSLHIGHSPVSHFRAGSFIQSPNPGDRMLSPTVARQIFISAPIPPSPIVQTESAPGQPVQSVQPSVQTLPTKKPSHSLNLFFRKIYNLSELRLDTMCKNFNLDEELIRITFTCFEWIMKNHAYIMKDRHLDQILMCVLYLICKIRNQPKQFTDILSYYKFQPQADSHVYRSVLLKQAADVPTVDQQEERDSGSGVSPSMPPPTPSKQSETSVTSENGEVRGDLIKFFNQVFLNLTEPSLKDFALKFSTNKKPENQPPLSPRCNFRAQGMSPRKQVSEKFNIYTRNLRPEDALQAQKTTTAAFTVSKSPAKMLGYINKMVRDSSSNVNVGVKRKLPLDDEEPGVKRSSVPVTTSDSVLIRPPPLISDH